MKEKKENTDFDKSFILNDNKEDKEAKLNSLLDKLEEDFEKDSESVNRERLWEYVKDIPEEEIIKLSVTIENLFKDWENEKWEDVFTLLKEKNNKIFWVA